MANIVNSQDKKVSLKTRKYAGIYSFGHDVEKEPVGQVTVYPESDTTILFYLDVCRGAPSYNLGDLFGRAAIKNDSAFHFSKEKGDEKGCALQMHFYGDTLTINTYKEYDECSFGYHVYPDHTYIREKKSIPTYFTNQEGDSIAFKNMTPEKYVHRFDDEK